MEESIDPFDFYLAENLHRTIEELWKMPNREYNAWRAFYIWRNAQRDLDK